MLIVLTEKEEKVLRLALDRAAADGEIRNSAAALISMWRNRGISAGDVLIPPPLTTPDYGLCIMPFGKHKGKALKDVPPDYLEWLHHSLTANPNEYYPHLCGYIEKFLFGSEDNGL